MSQPPSRFRRWADRVYSPEPREPRVAPRWAHSLVLVLALVALPILLAKLLAWIGLFDLPRVVDGLHDLALAAFSFAWAAVWYYERGPLA